MKLRSMKISWQLNISLIIFFLSMVFLGLDSIINSNDLWQNTDGMYKHPLIVQRAISSLKADILSLRLGTKVLVLEQKYLNKNEVHKMLLDLKTDEADTLKQLEIIYQSYLGPKGDIDRLNQTLLEWKTLRDETLRLYALGEILQAEKRVVNSGLNNSQYEAAILEIANILEFATKKADQFYTEAFTHKEAGQFEIVVALGIILLLMLVISFLLRRKILLPIKAHLKATEAMQEGEIDTRIEVETEDELGILARAFNLMAENVQSEICRKEGKAIVSNVMIRQDDLKLFCQEVLQCLLEQTDSQIGTVYIFNETTNNFENYSSIGLNKNYIKTYSTLSNEGAFDMAISSGKVQHITDIPSDSQVTYHTISGDYVAKEILTMPILKGKEVYMIISLASLKKYSEDSIWLANNLLNELSARFSSIFGTLKISEYSEDIQKANFELQQQSKELEMLANELTEQNMELEMQSTQLREATHVKSAFLSNMSHELRTPLNSVIALTSVLNKRLKGSIPEEEYSYLDVIERNGKHLLALVNDILDLSKVESGKEEISISSFNLKNLINEIVEMVDPIAQKKGIELKNDFSLEDIFISSDMKKCRHIFQNVIGNAVKFTDEGQVEITSTSTYEYINIFIKDTGVGIDGEHIGFIFDEFRQADESLTRRSGGTGLGLAIAKKYAELLGGSISVESKPGEGSTFLVKLPCEILYGNIKLKVKGSQNKQILLVEDSEPAIVQITDILDEQGYQVDLAHNGKEALVLLEEQIPDGIILDLMMPEMDGFELLKTIRSIEKFAYLPVLILTAKHVTKEELSFLKNNHVYQLIQKGDVDKKHLLSSIERMVNSNTNN